MMAGNPNWWSMNNMHPTPSFSLFPNYDNHHQSNSSLSLNPNMPADHHNHDFPHSWTQPLLGSGVGGDHQEDRFGGPIASDHDFDQSMKVENWETQIFDPCNNLKQQVVTQNSQLQGQQRDADDDDGGRSSWSQLVGMPLSSPTTSCVTTLNTNFLDFSNTNPPDHKITIQHHQDHSSHECNSTRHGGVSKKARVHSPPAQLPPLKVKKEKLRDGITALHQIVSPFGKTDTASVLLEAIGYIRFLQSQIEALSSPYLGNGSGNTSHQHSVHGDRNCIFPSDSGQLLHNNSLKRRAASKKSTQDGTKDLRSRGLCLVPVSCTHNVGNDNINGADYWTPALGGGGF